MDRNKSYWYIERIVTYVRFKDGCVTKPIYERRVDKDPEEVEIGDRVVLFVAPDIKKGVVRNTVLYYDGFFEAVVDVDGIPRPFYASPDMIGILKKVGSDEN